MACYHPIPAYQSGPGAPVRLWPPLGTHTTKLPCGSCIGCKTDHAADWSRRAQHEASSWDHNCFVTLTYDNESLPYRGYLEPKDLQRFLKRLRRALDRRPPALLTTPIPHYHLRRLPKGVQGPRQQVVRTGFIRYLASGEYGDRTSRPHYHILLFNCEFADKVRVGKDLYESPTLAKLWKHGVHRIGTLTGASANYVAQYTLKGHEDMFRSFPEAASTGAFGSGPVKFYDQDGVIIPRPFLRASTKPPLGNEWIKKYKTDLQHGYLISQNRKNRIPRGIKKQLQKIDPQILEAATLAAQEHKRGSHNLDAAERIHHRKNELKSQRPL